MARGPVLPQGRVVLRARGTQALLSGLCPEAARAPPAPFAFPAPLLAWDPELGLLGPGRRICQMAGGACLLDVCQTHVDFLPAFDPPFCLENLLIFLVFSVASSLAFFPSRGIDSSRFRQKRSRIKLHSAPSFTSCAAAVRGGCSRAWLSKLERFSR